MLTEQDFLNVLNDNLSTDDYGASIDGIGKTSKLIHSQHIAECERLMELAFNAARQRYWSEPDREAIGTYRTFQDFKDSLKP